MAGIVEAERSVEPQHSPQRDAKSDNRGDEGELPEKLHLGQQSDRAENDRNLQKKLGSVIVICATLHQLSLVFQFTCVLLYVNGAGLAIGRVVFVLFLGIWNFFFMFLWRVFV